jgi:predicted unusual protein kinase regulating ubiquinone biosynthesis (AarF/ABC1/UbiB family)
MSQDDDSLPSGRFARFRKLAGLTASLSADALARGVKQLSGGEPDAVLSQATAEKLASTLGEMKGAAMKLGQALSMDPEAFPPEARAVLARLQNAAPPMPWTAVREVVEEELGEPPESAFASFDEVPLAAASLGQVHRATTHDGQAVVVKVQYPRVADALRSDLDNLGLLVKALGAHQKMDLRKYYEEVKRELVHELDYRREARLARAYAEALRPFPDLAAPAPVEALTAGRVLTLERFEGPTLKELLKPEAEVDEATRFRVGRQLVLNTFGPFLHSGLMHVDPHPGNFIVLPDGRLGVLDFGSIKQFSPVFVEVNRAMYRLGVLGREQARVDVVDLSRKSGFDISVPDAACEQLVHAIVDTGCRAMRAPHWDYAQDDTQKLMEQLFKDRFGTFLKVRPPEEAPLYFRAVGGLIQNLKLLRARGPFRDVFLALLPHAQP